MLEQDECGGIAGLCVRMQFLGPAAKGDMNGLSRGQRVHTKDRVVAFRVGTHQFNLMLCRLTTIEPAIGVYSVLG